MRLRTATAIAALLSLLSFQPFEAAAYEIVWDPNSFQQIGPDMFPVPPRPGATSRAMLVGQTVKAKSDAVNRAHTFRTPSTEVHVIGWEIEFVIRPESGEPPVPALPVELAITASGSIDTVADATARGPGRRRTSVMGVGEFTGTGELGDLELEITAEQTAQAKAPQVDDPAVMPFDQTKIGFAFLEADGVTKHKLYCYASTAARARVWDDENHLLRPRAEAHVDFLSGSYGLSCTVGLHREMTQEQAQEPIEP